MKIALSAAAKLDSSGRQKLAMQALSGLVAVQALADDNAVSRKFVYTLKNKASLVLSKAFGPAVSVDGVLFELPVTPVWLKQMMVALTLIGRCSIRGVVEFMRDLIGVNVSEGHVFNVLQDAAQRASLVNGVQDLSDIRVGLHDEIFQGNQAVLAGVDAQSTYCYLLSGEDARDADTWAIRLWDAAEQGFKPHYTIADQGTGLRAGQELALPGTPCHGDVFHILQQCESLVNVLTTMAQGAATHCQAVQKQMDEAALQGRSQALAHPLGKARRAELSAALVAKDIKILTQWLRLDVLELAGPCLPTRLELFDFVTQEFLAREHLNPKRIRKVRIALQNQRNDLLAFAGVLDSKLSGIATMHSVPDRIVRAVCTLHRKHPTSSTYWQAWNQLRHDLGGEFYIVKAAVTQALEQIPRCSSLVENLNSRLRTYFTLRRQVGNTYLGLLQFFLNHRRFMRSRVPERADKSPCELLTGKAHAHWLSLLGFGQLQALRA
ncbi:hypothetical protein ACVBEH_13070 [Roseateles sp. GG27B]